MESKRKKGLLSFISIISNIHTFTRKMHSSAEYTIVLPLYVADTSFFMLVYQTLHLCGCAHFLCHGKLQNLSYKCTGHLM